MIPHPRLSAGVFGMLFVIALGGCGGGSSNSSPEPEPEVQPPPPPPPAVNLDTQYRVSTDTPFPPECDGIIAVGTNFANAEVEPFVAVDPGNPLRLYGAWQADRWSSGGAHGLVLGASSDGGRTWTRQAPPFSRCAGGNAGNGGDYERSTDPWISVSPDGTVHAIALGFSGQTFQPGSDSAVLATRSSDGGASWSPLATLIRQGGTVFHDKESITADPTDSRFVFAVWDRISTDNFGPTWFARSTDGGLGWEPARVIFDPGVNRQTIGNIIVVLADGALVNGYTQIDAAANGQTSAYVDVIRSTDKGQTWSAPIRIASALSVGTVDPETAVRVRDATITPSFAAAGGSVFAAWQDSRFSNGARDGIAFSRSDDGGLTWSTPVRVNANPAVAAFVPAVHVRADGMIGVSYYDFRPNTTDRATLYTNLWLARSPDGINWQESQVAGPFDLATAPLSAAGNQNGYFLGDYSGLTSSGNVFVPFYSRTTGTAGNRTDIFSAPAVSVTQGSQAMKAELAARGAPAKVTPTPIELSPQARQRIAANIEASMKIRVPAEPSSGPRD